MQVMMHVLPSLRLVVGEVRRTGTISLLRVRADLESVWEWMCRQGKGCEQKRCRKRKQCQRRKRKRWTSKTAHSVILRFPSIHRGAKTPFYTQPPLYDTQSRSCVGLVPMNGMCVEL